MQAEALALPKVVDRDCYVIYLNVKEQQSRVGRGKSRTLKKKNLRVMQFDHRGLLCFMGVLWMCITIIRS